MLKYAISLLAASSVIVSAGAPSIGFVKSAGDIRVDGSSVRGNSNLFDGTLVETTTARSVVQLSDTQITLAPESRLRVYRDRAILEKGLSVVRESPSVKDGERFTVEAATMRVAQSTPNSVVQIELTGASLLTVSTRLGAADVRTASNLLAANIRTGMALSFEPQTGSSTAVKMTGMVEARDGSFFLTDETSKVMVQLEGLEVPKFAGKKVKISGTSVAGATPAGGASLLVHIATIKFLVAGGTAAAASGGAAAGGAAAGGGVSAVAIVAIVGGVAVAGAVGGLAAAGSFSSSSVSRP